MTASPISLGVSGIFVYGNATGVTTPTMARQSFAGLLHRTDASTLRSGVLYGGPDSSSTSALKVTGTATTGTATVTVAAGTAVIARSGQGVYLANNPSTVTLDVTSASNNPWTATRTDTVWIQQRDYAIDTTDSGVYIGITAGSTGTPTTPPSPPTGAVALATIYMTSNPAASGGTSGAGTTITMVAPYTNTSGGITVVRSQTERDSGNTLYPTPTWKSGDLVYSIADSAYYFYTGSAWSPFQSLVGQDLTVYNGTASYSYPSGNTIVGATLSIPILPYQTTVIATGVINVTAVSVGSGTATAYIPSLSYTTGTLTSPASPSFLPQNAITTFAYPFSAKLVIPANTATQTIKNLWTASALTIPGTTVSFSYTATLQYIRTVG